MANIQPQKPYVASNDEKDAIQILVKNIVNAINNHEGGYDRTFKSVVTGIKGSKYTIIDEGGTSHTVKCAIPNASISIGTSVWVKIPCGKMNQMHICGIY